MAHLKTVDKMSDAQIEILRLWREGMTVGLIAQNVGMTKGAVSGNLHRFRKQKLIELRPKKPPKRAQKPRFPMRPRKLTALTAVRPFNAGHKPEEVPKIEEKEPPFRPRAELIAQDAARKGISIHRLTRETCRWVLPKKNKYGLHLYCGDETETDRVYCEAHCKRAFCTDYKPTGRTFVFKTKPKEVEPISY